MARDNTWDGEERRSGKERRNAADRRSVSRGIWERRSGFDRRGHKLYSTVHVTQSEVDGDEPEHLGETG